MWREIFLARENTRKTNLVILPKAFEYPVYFRKGDEFKPIPNREVIAGEKDVNEKNTIFGPLTTV